MEKVNFGPRRLAVASRHFHEGGDGCRRAEKTVIYPSILAGKKQVEIGKRGGEGHFLSVKGGCGKQKIEIARKGEKGTATRSVGMWGLLKRPL